MIGGRRSIGAIAALALLAGPSCLAPDVPIFARSEIAADFETYAIRRVALLPPLAPRDADFARPQDLAVLQDDLLGFLSSGTPYEFIELSTHDLSEIDAGDPRGTGRLSVESLLSLNERFRVDAVFFTQVTREKLHPPLALGLHAELVAVETGQVIWNAAVQIDGADDPVRAAVRAFYERAPGQPEGGEGWEVAMMSPRRFARFASWQLAQLL